MTDREFWEKLCRHFVAIAVLIAKRWAIPLDDKYARFVTEQEANRAR